jgi:hypothetical protein
VLRCRRVVDGAVEIRWAAVEPIVDRRFEIEFLDPGVEAYDVTFG